MSFEFRWNIYADQPHNVAFKKERLRHHLKYAESYVSLVTSNFRRAVPILSRYRTYRKKLYKEPVRIEKSFALSVSPSREKSEEVIVYLKELGIQKSLIRVPSWERDRLPFYKEFFELLVKHGIEVTIALLQQRDDVLSPLRWKNFVNEAFSRFGRVASFFEIGHAWNRTKWGVWDYKEYLELALRAAHLAKKQHVKLVGPAVIDFEFHLYPAVLDVVPFDKVSSLLYVDRMGAPENRQFGWDTSGKVALLKAVVDGCSRQERDVWITEVNWPLKGTGKYSPASGKPNVTEEEQADYLVRYYILCLASGFIERIYWWQLAAPGYGLIDSRGKEWRKRPSFYAMKTLVGHLEGSIFTEKLRHPQAEMFLFRKGQESFLVCWTRLKKGVGLFFKNTKSLEGKDRATSQTIFSRRVVRVVDTDGKEIPCLDGFVKIDGSPKYIFFK